MQLSFFPLNKLTLGRLIHYAVGRLKLINETSTSVYCYKQGMPNNAVELVSFSEENIKTIPVDCGACECLQRTHHTGISPSYTRHFFPFRNFKILMINYW